MSISSFTRGLRTGLAILVFLSFVPLGSAVGQLLHYEIVDLGPVNQNDDFPGSKAYGMNATGEAVGNATFGGGFDYHPVFWPMGNHDEDMTAIDLGPDTIIRGRAIAINDDGVICGYHTDPYGVSRGMIWTAPDTYTEIPGFDDPDGKVNPLDINNEGLVAGYAGTEQCSACWHAFTWDGETLVDLGTFEGESGPGWQSMARGLNDLGQVVGDASYNDGDPWNSRIRAFLYLPEPAYGLPAGLNDLDDWSWVYYQTSWGVDINMQGQVLLTLNELNQFGQTVVQFGLWLPKPAYGFPAGVTKLGNPGPVLASAFPRRINEHGAIVGKAVLDPDNPFAPYVAFHWQYRNWTYLWDKLLPADQSVWAELEVAADINDDGVIVGLGYLRASVHGHGFRLYPVYDTTAVPGTTEVPAPVVFHAASPNPFNPRTSLSFSLAESRQVELNVHDLRGGLVANLHSGRLEEGRHTVVWNGQTLSGRRAAAGTYLVKLHAGGSVLLQKISLVK